MHRDYLKASCSFPLPFLSLPTLQNQRLESPTFDLFFSMALFLSIECQKKKKKKKTNNNPHLYANSSAAYITYNTNRAGKNILSCRQRWAMYVGIFYPGQLTQFLPLSCLENIVQVRCLISQQTVIWPCSHSRSRQQPKLANQRKCLSQALCNSAYVGESSGKQAGISFLKQSIAFVIVLWVAVHFLKTL